MYYQLDFLWIWAIDFLSGLPWKIPAQVMKIFSSYFFPHFKSCFRGVTYQNAIFLLDLPYWERDLKNLDIYTYSRHRVLVDSEHLITVFSTLIYSIPTINFWVYQIKVNAWLVDLNVLQYLLIHCSWTRIVGIYCSIGGLG